MGQFEISRRAVLGGALGASILALPGCASMGGGFSLVDAIRRLLTLSSERAFARLVAPDGYWDDAVATMGLSNLLGTRGNVLSNILTFNKAQSRGFKWITVENLLTHGLHDRLAGCPYLKK